MRDRGGARPPLVELTLARVHEFLREPEAIFWVFVFPILMAFALGIAFRSRGDDPVFIGVRDGPGAAGVVQAFEGAPGVRSQVIAPADIDRALRDGVVQLVVVPGTPPAYRYDPSRAESRLARLMADNVLQQAAGRTNVFTAGAQEVMTQGSRYIDWLIPGLLGMNIMSTGIWSIGFSIVQARTRQLLKRLVASPMKRSHYLIAQMLGRLIFLAFEVSALLVFGWYAFGVGIQGSLWLLAALSLLGAVSFAGIGLLVASRARTVEAVSGLINIVMLPMWILSGVFFSSRNFPDSMQPYIRLLPLTALNDALRAVMIEGASVSAVVSEITVLTVWGGASFALALRLFRWR